MKVVILCGGFGTRLSEETSVKPKPMVKIGNKPILQHIINLSLLVLREYVACSKTRF